MQRESRQLKFLVDAQLASAFKSACKRAKVSMAGELTAHMTQYIQADKTSVLRTGALRVATRR